MNGKGEENIVINIKSHKKKKVISFLVIKAQNYNKGLIRQKENVLTQNRSMNIKETTDFLGIKVVDFEIV